MIGATGNVGTSVLAALAGEDAVEEIVGVARRLPELRRPKVRWVSADVTSSDLSAVMQGADAVVHLAWAIQPSRDEATLERVNVAGSERVFRAVAESGVPTLVYASSVGTYAPGPKHERVDESWPASGIPTSFYSRHKARVEQLLDRFESERPQVRVVRLRPGLIFKSDAASEIRRLFIGPLLPNFAVRPALIPFVPRIERLRFQVVHSRDAGEAYRQALVRRVSGPFNIAADPVLDPEQIGRLLRARPVRIPGGAVRMLADLSWRLRLQPSPPGWVDMALGVPLMDTARAAEELGWRPKWNALQALGDLLGGLRESDDLGTPPLEREAGGRGRVGEFKSGVGARQ